MTICESLVQLSPCDRADTRPATIFLLVAPIIFAAYALLTPPFQVFDENQHLYRAWQLSSLQLTSERRGLHSGGVLPAGLGDATFKEIGSLKPQGERKVAVRPLSRIFDWNTPIGADRPPVYYDFFGSAVYSPVGYTLQIIAIRIGEATNLSVEWTLRLGRLLNCGLCIALIWAALRILPYGRWIMLTIALSPPAAAGAASFGQDGLVLGAGFILIALGLTVAAEGAWSARRVVAVALAAIVVTLAKFVYLPLVAVAVLPKPYAASWRRWLAIPLSIAGFTMLLLLLWLRVNAHSIVPFETSLPSVSEHVSWLVSHPIKFLAMISRTYISLLPSLWANLYEFGDSTVPNIVTAALVGSAAIVVTMICGEGHDIDLPPARRAWMLLIFASIAVLIATALFLSFAPRGAAFIRGIQARYFLPVLPVAGIALIRRGDRAPAPLLPIVFGLVAAAHALTLGTILRTFYA